MGVMMLSAWILIAGWFLLVVAGAARRHLEPTDVARGVKLLEDGARLRGGGG